MIIWPYWLRKQLYKLNLVPWEGSLCQALGQCRWVKKAGEQWKSKRAKNGSREKGRACKRLFKYLNSPTMYPTQLQKTVYFVKKRCQNFKVCLAGGFHVFAMFVLCLCVCEVKRLGTSKSNDATGIINIPKTLCDACVKVLFNLLKKFSFCVFFWLSRCGCVIGS